MDLRAALIDALFNAPYSNEDQADALLPLVRAYAARELNMAADAAEHCIENPEMPWAQGVAFVVESLRDRADAITKESDRA